jgi:hypothetical protein
MRCLAAIEGQRIFTGQERPCEFRYSLEDSSNPAAGQRRNRHGPGGNLEAIGQIAFGVNQDDAFVRRRRVGLPEP